MGKLFESERSKSKRIDSSRVRRLPPQLCNLQVGYAPYDFESSHDALERGSMAILVGSFTYQLKEICLFLRNRTRTQSTVHLFLCHLMFS